MKTSFLNYGKFVISIYFFSTVMFTNSFAACATTVDVGGQGMTSVGTISGLIDNSTDPGSAVSRSGISSMIAAASTANTVILDKCTMSTTVDQYWNGGPNPWQYNMYIPSANRPFTVTSTNQNAPGLLFSTPGNYSVEASFSIQLNYTDYTFQSMPHADKLFLMNAIVKRNTPADEIGLYLTSEARTHAQWFASWKAIWTFNSSFNFEVLENTTTQLDIYVGGFNPTAYNWGQRLKDKRFNISNNSDINDFVPRAVRDSGKCRFEIRKLN